MSYAAYRVAEPGCESARGDAMPGAGPMSGLER
jgi:hypothetical protein